jgi:predicted ribosomally synthesized peptide with nif11-like leader
MSKESLEQFLNQVAKSEELQTRIDEAAKIDELIALGAEHGCEFSAEDLAENAELSDAGNAELNDEELDAVAGGHKGRIRDWIRDKIIRTPLPGPLPDDYAHYPNCHCIKCKPIINEPM